MKVCQYATMKDPKRYAVKVSDTTMMIEKQLLVKKQLFFFTRIVSVHQQRCNGH